MTAPAIRVENLSKRYTLGLTHAGSIRELARRLTDRLLRRAPDSTLPAPRSRLPALRSPLSASSSFWALEDVSFEVQPGEVVGIIGRKRRRQEHPVINDPQPHHRPHRRTRRDQRFHWPASWRSAPASTPS